MAYISNRPTALVLASAASFQFPLIRARIGSPITMAKNFCILLLALFVFLSSITENMVSDYPLILFHLEITKNGSSLLPFLIFAGGHGQYSGESKCSSRCGNYRLSSQLIVPWHLGAVFIFYSLIITCSLIMSIYKSLNSSD